MKGLKGYTPLSLIEWSGKMTAILFLGKCNFRCPWCHNRDLVLNPDEFPDLKFDEILADLEERKQWIDAVEITGGEPTIYPELEKISEKIKKCDFLVKLDTNGTNPDVVQKLLDKKLVDYVAMDIKNHLEKYSEASGVKANIEAIQKSIKQIMDSGIDYEFRTTVVPGIHAKKDIEKIGMLLKGTKRFYIQNFVAKNTVDPKLEGHRSFTETEMEEFKKILNKYIDEVHIR